MQLISKKSGSILVLLGLPLLFHYGLQTEKVSQEVAEPMAVAEPASSLRQPMAVQNTDSPREFRSPQRPSPVVASHPDEKSLAMSLDDFHAGIRNGELTYDEGMRFLIHWQDRPEFMEIRSSLEAFAASPDEKHLLFLALLRVEDYAAALDLADQEDLLQTATVPEIADAYGDLLLKAQRREEAERAYEKALRLSAGLVPKAEDRYLVIKNKLQRLHLKQPR